MQEKLTRDIAKLELANFVLFCFYQESPLINETETRYSKGKQYIKNQQNNKETTSGRRTRQNKDQKKQNLVRARKPITG
jgi:hypothetical protein